MNSDYSEKDNQIGCGYCKYEPSCKTRIRTENRAKNCVDFTHYSDTNNNNKEKKWMKFEFQKRK